MVGSSNQFCYALFLPSPFPVQFPLHIHTHLYAPPHLCKGSELFLLHLVPFYLLVNPLVTADELMVRAPLNMKIGAGGQEKTEQYPVTLVVHTMG